MKTYLKSTTRIVLFTACMGGLAACSGDDSLKEGIIKRFKDDGTRDGTRVVTQIARTVDGVKVTGKLVANDAAAKEFMKNFRDNSTRAGVRVAEHISQGHQRKVEGGTLYRGTTNVNGPSYNYLIYYNDDAPVGAGQLISANDNTDWAKLTLGEKASKLPTGTHKYSGYSYINNLRRGGGDEHGDLDMTVDFSKKLITKFDATTDHSKVTGTDIPVNLAHGTFKGDITATGNFVGNNNLSGEVYGDFHGVGATGVSGIYDANQAGSGYSIDGFFAGSKQPKQ